MKSVKCGLKRSFAVFWQHTGVTGIPGNFTQVTGKNEILLGRHLSSSQASGTPVPCWPTGCSADIKTDMCAYLAVHINGVILQVNLLLARCRSTYHFLQKIKELSLLIEFPLTLASQALPWPGPNVGQLILQAYQLQELGLGNGSSLSITRIFLLGRRSRCPSRDFYLSQSKIQCKSAGQKRKPLHKPESIHILRVMDYGVEANSTSDFYVMEYLQGKVLRYHPPPASFFCRKPQTWRQVAWDHGTYQGIPVSREIC